MNVLNQKKWYEEKAVAQFMRIELETNKRFFENHYQSPDQLVAFSKQCCREYL